MGVRRALNGRAVRSSFEDRSSPNVNASMNASKAKRGRHHLADGWPILLLRTSTPILPHPEAALECQEDQHQRGQEDAPDREKVERSTVSHTAPDRSA